MRRIVIVAAVAGLLSLTLGPAPVAAADTQQFAGPFTATEVHPPACQSPVGICTHGMLYNTRGDLVATYDFTMDTTTPSGVGITLNFTGHSVITKALAPLGTMVSHDDGQFTPQLLGGSPLTTNAHVYAGTGAYVGATGLFVATGRLDLVSGTVKGTYTGTVTVPK